jgi:alkyl hydroperoxide reductase subunit AhpC
MTIMGLRINDTIPNLTVETDQGSFALHDWIGDDWAILFSHPKDFTPVCTTEFGAVARLADEWAKRGTKVMGISVDGVEDHKKWKADIETFGGAAAGFPIIADEGLALSKAFDMLPAEAYLPEGRTPADSQTVRSVFIVGPDKKLKLTMTYPMNVGRNFAEVLRALDGLQTAARENVATPADWVPGQDVVVPVAVSTRMRSRNTARSTRGFPTCVSPSSRADAMLELPAIPNGRAGFSDPSRQRQGECRIARVPSGTLL